MRKRRNIFDNLLENFFPLKWWANQVQETVLHQLFLPLTNGRNHFFQIWNKTGTNFYEKNLSRLSPDCFRPRGNRNYIKGTQSIPIGGFKLVRFPTYFIFMFVGKPDWFKLAISEIGNWKYYNVYKPKMEWKKSISWIGQTLLTVVQLSSQLSLDAHSSDWQTMSPSHLQRHQGYL